MKEIRAMSPGKLGHGCDPKSVARALAHKPDFIGVDAGSTDMGAYYLGRQTPFFHPISIKRDMALLLQARARPQDSPGDRERPRHRY